MIIIKLFSTNKKSDDDIEKIHKALRNASKIPLGAKRDVALYKVLGQYSELLRKNPKKGDALIGRSLVYLGLFQIKEALHDISKYIKYYPQHESGYLTRADICIDSKKYTQAAQDFLKALIIAPDNVRALVALSQIYLMHSFPRNTENAKKLYKIESKEFIDKAMELDKPSAEVFLEIYTKKLQ